MTESSQQHRVVERLDRRTIGKQIVLPFSKAVEISIKSLRTRFRRSLITVGLIMLAIAFLMTILTTNALQNALVNRANVEPPWGEEVMRGLGGLGYLQEGDVFYRVTKVKNEATGKLEETDTERVQVIDPDELVRAEEYVGLTDAWRTRTNNLKASLAKRMDLAGETEAAAVGITAQQWWLIGLSLAVAIVGIVNAMLMSVTERYREIGTMKCLGALDSFIIRLFLLESVFQGTMGTFVGVVIGFVLILVYTLFIYGWVTIQTFPGLTIITYALWSLFLGFLLSILGAILPAYRAAKMQPVEAMRVEE